MLQRCSASRLLPSLQKRIVVISKQNVPKHFSPHPVRVCVRGYASSGAVSGSSSSTSAHSGLAVFAPLTNELDKICPRFEIDGEDIEVLRGPVEFYEALKAKILKARRRIYLSTLYIGSSEHELIATIRTALQQNDQLKVSFLTDALRGTRGAPKPTTASLLASLITEFGPNRVQIRLYHTPNLTGLRKRFIPERINEGWGLQHMKLYGIDDEIILSGANLSNDYFTNRQDRYHVFKSKQITDYYASIHDAVSSISFDVQPTTEPSGYSMSWPTTTSSPSPLEDAPGYIDHAAKTLGPLITPPKNLQNQSSRDTAHTTIVYPILQFTPLLPADRNQDSSSDTAKSTELPALAHILTTLRSPPFNSSRITFTAGYFNPPPNLVALLLSSKFSHLDVIGASPEANGFYGSKGVSGMLPAAYTLLAKRFLQSVEAKGLGTRTRILEWKRGVVNEPGGWTYHAKGIWVTLANTASTSTAEETGEGEVHGPSITVIGSSNYTTRAHTLDLEANALIVTADPRVQKKLKAEEQWLKEDARAVGLEDFRQTKRRVSLWVRVSMWIVTAVGGAL